MPWTGRALAGVGFRLLDYCEQLGVGAGNVPPLVSAGLALVAGLCSLARLRPSIRDPKGVEADDAQPAVSVR